MRREYLRDKASRRGMRGGIHTEMSDGRNAWGSKGGYVFPSKHRGRDRMVSDDYRPEHIGRYPNYHHSEYSNEIYPHSMEQYGQYYRPMGYEIYGYGGMIPHEDYARGRGRRKDYNYDDYGMEYEYENLEKEYEEELDKVIKRLKAKDKFGWSFEQIKETSKQMGATFKDYDEKELYATYLMQVSDLRSVTDPRIGIQNAIDFLEDDDVAKKGSEKLYCYIMNIVLGEID